jgi:hypothetical protein
MRKLRWKRRDVTATDVPGIPVHSPQEIAQTDLERLVAVRAAEPARRAEIGKGRLAERALRRLALGSRHLLVQRLEEIVDLRLGRGERRLDSTLCCALLAEMQLSHPAPLDFSELDYSLAILAQIANHLYDDLICFTIAQLTTL